MLRFDKTFPDFVQLIADSIKHADGDVLHKHVDSFLAKYDVYNLDWRAFIEVYTFFYHLLFPRLFAVDKGNLLDERVITHIFNNVYYEFFCKYLAKTEGTENAREKSIYVTIMTLASIERKELLRLDRVNPGPLPLHGKYTKKISDTDMAKQLFMDWYDLKP